jgi:hypothetical protein
VRLAREVGVLNEGKGAEEEAEVEVSDEGHRRVFGDGEEEPREDNDGEDEARAHGLTPVHNIGDYFIRNIIREIEGYVLRKTISWKKGRTDCLRKVNQKQSKPRKAKETRSIRLLIMLKDSKIRRQAQFSKEKSLG